MDSNDLFNLRVTGVAVEVEVLVTEVVVLVTRGLLSAMMTFIATRNMTAVITSKCYLTHCSFDPTFGSIYLLTIWIINIYFYLKITLTNDKFKFLIFFIVTLYYNV